MTGIVAAGQNAKAVLAAGATFGAALKAIIDWLLSFSSPASIVLRTIKRPLLPREFGLAAADVFPLPLVPVPKETSSGLGHQAWLSAWLVNLWVVFLNIARAGPEQLQVCRYLPSAAQFRCLGSLRRRAEAFVADAPREEVGGENAIRKFLLLDTQGYTSHRPVLPLGVRCAVPDAAGMVNTAGVLDESFPDLARICREPGALLKDDLDFGDDAPRPIHLLGQVVSSFRCQGLGKWYAGDAAYDRPTSC